MIAIRTDANEHIATGHLMRCLSIANEIKNLGGNCVFIISDENTVKGIRGWDFDYICLNSMWNELEDEICKLKEIIRIKNIEMLLVDSYSVTQDYLRIIRESVKIAYIDDINMFKYPVDYLINYNIFYDLFNYGEIYRDMDTELIMGCDYTPLRCEFKNRWKFKVNKNVLDIMITTGGSDDMNLAGSFLDRAIRTELFDKVVFRVVAGKYNKNVGSLRVLADRYENIKLYVNVKNISKIMTKSDIAVSASGSTLYELCACGVPTVCFSLADNQVNCAKCFAALGFMQYAGDIRDGVDNCVSAIINSIEIFCEDFELRSKMSEKMQKLIDGNGAKRMAKVLLSHTNFSVQPSH